MDSPTDGPTWSDIAEWYDALLVAGSGPHVLARDVLLDLVGDAAGQEVLDVACGQGLATRALAEVGARTIGADASPAMLERARAHGVAPGLELDYRLDDAQHLGSFGDHSFDGVTCQLGLMDVPDLDATLAAVHRVLRPAGWFVFVLGHPCFLAPHARPARDVDGRPAVTVTGYFDEGFWRSSNPQGVRRAGNHHRTLSTYLNALGHAGFTLEDVREPLAGALLAEQAPLYREVPIFLAARTRAA